MDPTRSSTSTFDAILRTYVHDANARIAKNGLDAVAGFAEGEMLDVFVKGLRWFTRYAPQNVKALRRIVADDLIAKNEYAL
ncbi:MAG: hypothetical protein AAFZ52_19520 [Bacteroidota bacterium]